MVRLARRCHYLYDHYRTPALRRTSNDRREGALLLVHSATNNESMAAPPARRPGYLRNSLLPVPSLGGAKLGAAALKHGSIIERGWMALQTDKKSRNSKQIK